MIRAKPWSENQWVQSEDGKKVSCGHIWWDHQAFRMYIFLEIE